VQEHGDGNAMQRGGSLQTSRVGIEEKEELQHNLNNLGN